MTTAPMNINGTNLTNVHVVPLTPFSVPVVLTISPEYIEFHTVGTKLTAITIAITVMMIERISIVSTSNC